MSEFLHVSEFYETSAAVGLTFIAVFELVVFCLDLQEHIQAKKQQQMEEEISWCQGQKSEVEPIVQSETERKTVSRAQQEINELEQKSIEKTQEVPEGEDKSKSIEEVEGKDQPAPEADAEKPPVASPPQRNLQPISLRRQKIVHVYLAINKLTTEHTAIIFPLLVVGILTDSTLVFSLAAFFCYLFCVMMFDFLRLEEQLKDEYKRGIVFRRVVKLLSSLFVISIFISYWSISQFDN